MTIFYIDANIYLGLYNSNRPEYKKLIDSLIELKDNIFISNQIVFEVNRNKLSVFRNSLDNYIKQTTLIKTQLPEHLDSDDSRHFTTWNTDRKKIEELILKSNSDLNLILDEVLLGISCSSDNISKKLAAIFEMARKPHAHDLLKAKFRKEIGNPPGKPNDPLGDQLSWEMLLSSLENTDMLYIVSTDRDYFAEHKEKLYLNPILYDDIKTKNAKVQIKLFNKLSEALRDYSSLKKIESLPDNEELNKISESEENNLKYGLPARPNNCPSCETSDAFLNGSYLRSVYGGLTLQFVCKVCGYKIDTGESFD
jgi:DNA-directed RNA polymerase subunit M/transcription elongation factor TFIIS